MKLRYIVALAACTGVLTAGPGKPGFAGVPQWVDVNGNGQIEPEEREAFGKLRKDAAKGLAERADANGDGEVDHEERLNAIAAMHAKVEEKRCELFLVAAGVDGKLNFEEFSAQHPVDKLPEHVARRLFGLLDGDGDTFVTKDEFLASLNEPEEEDDEEDDPVPDPETPFPDTPAP